MRLEPLTELTPEQATLRMRIAGNRRGLPAPFQVWIRSPELCDRVEALATYCQPSGGTPLVERAPG
jgi:4-carboxymuconolactone decarboxylase